MKKNIDYNVVLDFIGKYSGEAYSAPKNVSDPEKKEKFTKIKEKGKEAAKEFKKILNNYSENNKFETEVKEIWQNSRNIKKYFWGQMKYAEYKDNPISISLFVVKEEGKTRFRISLEIEDDFFKGDENLKKECMNIYHSYLDEQKKEDIEYISINSNQEKTGIINDSFNEIKNKIASGEIVEKIQPCIYVDRKDDKTGVDKTNEQYEKEISDAIKNIIPYYKYVISNFEEYSSSKTVQHEEETPEVKYDKNMILYGPPGTGKTYSAAIYAVAICDNKDINDVKVMNYDDVMDRYRELLSPECERVSFTTFHQSYGYEEFIEGIKPVLNNEENNTSKSGVDIGYKIVDGAFKSFCDKARLNKDKPFVFVIDEINRGNVSKIFGELITLMEDTKRERMKESISVVLPYSGKSFSVPSNVYIIGTMNTADRSIALIDTALRRRFQFIEMMPDVSVLENIDIEGLNVAEMLEKINERITFLYDREHTIGHAFFTKLAKEKTVDTLHSIFKKSVIPLLQEYFYEDYQKIQLVLGDNSKEDRYKFIVEENVNVKDIFNGDVADVVDLPSKKYTINEEAFSKLESYKQIIRRDNG